MGLLKLPAGQDACLALRYPNYRNLAIALAFTPDAVLSGALDNISAVICHTLTLCGRVFARCWHDFGSSDRDFDLS